MDWIKKYWVNIFHFTIGVILFKSTLNLLIDDQVIEVFIVNYGFPNWMRLLLAWSEISAIILFLIPRTFWIGAWLLLAVFGWAIFLHTQINDNPLELFFWIISVIFIMIYYKRNKNAIYT